MSWRSLGARPLLLAAALACHGNDAPTAPPTIDAAISVSTDMARYAPNQSVAFTLDGAIPPGTRVRYQSLDSVVADAPVTASTWTWLPPSRDFTGYLAEVYRTQGDSERVLATVGVDVSSTWTRFPRYGFLSDYPAPGAAPIAAVLDDLNRHHIDGIEFYDWQYKHHLPLAGTPAAPTPVYRDIIGREIYYATVKAYIDAAHARSMGAMFYDLVLGAWSDAAADGVDERWYLFTDSTHTAKDRHVLPSPPFVSDIYVVDPGNAGWQDWLAAQARNVYAALPFDGYQMDQLGERGYSLYDYDGRPIDLAARFAPFIAAMQRDRPDKLAVMNAPNQYGQASISSSPTAFLYSEVWGPNDTFANLSQILFDDASLGGGRAAVLAAYVNRGRSGAPGFFDTPAVLLTDAVIFAFGGAHLELGEHLLGNEYFPNGNLAMRDDLKRALVSYYDFLTAYENLLRDGGRFGMPAVSAATTSVSLTAWPPRLGAVSFIGKMIGDREVLHLLNFGGVSTLDWRDDAGTQTTPRHLDRIPLAIYADRSVRRVWFASPDVHGGAAITLPFTQTGTALSFTIPSLDYWDMVVVEYR